jgi:alpha-beta hydrolase superfamily lysophospholipase
MSFLRKSRPWRWAAIALLVPALLAGCATLDEQQRRWIFQPAAVDPWAGERSMVGEVQERWIDFSSAQSQQPVRLHALWHPNADPKAPVLLYLHGAQRTVWGSGSRIRHLHELGFAVLAFDYRGFGQSTEALPSENMANEDARAAWDWLAREHPQRNRYIFGHSLGGALAVQLASEVGDAKGLIVEGTFTSIADVFRSFRWGWLPITPLITQRFEAAERIAQVRAPVLVVHGSDDSLIRPELGRALFEKATAPKLFVLVEGGTHFSTSGRGRAQYREALRELFGLKS